MREYLHLTSVSVIIVIFTLALRGSVNDSTILNVSAVNSNCDHAPWTNLWDLTLVDRLRLSVGTFEVHVALFIQGSLVSTSNCSCKISDLNGNIQEMDNQWIINIIT